MKLRRVLTVILGLDPRIPSPGDPRVEPEDDGAFVQSPERKAA
jgi:hypothetical protein